MVLHWRRCGRVGGRQIIKKDKPKEGMTKFRRGSFHIDTGKNLGEVRVNPTNREVLFRIAGFTSDQGSEEVQISDD